jgi:ribosomal protein L37E
VVIARLTAAQARAAGIPPPGGTGSKVRVRKVAAGSYHTVCKRCGEEFHTRKAEDEHVGNGHTRFELVWGR